MIRIAENRCGYINGYTCSPIEPLNDIFAETPTDIFRTESPTDSDWVWTDSLIVDYGHTYTHQQECIDNYAQVPQSFEGFVLTMPEIADMSGGTYSRPFEVPEIACRTNMDPFVDGKSVQNASADYTAMSNALYDGLIDLYNNVYEYKDPARQAYVNPEPTVFDVLIDHNASGVDKTQVTGTTSGRYYFRQTVKPAYNFTVGPGLLEPMLDTMFPPVSVDTITGPDALGDFTVWLFDEFNAWKGLIDDRLSNMHQAVAQFDYGSINGMLNLEAAKNREGPCDNFTIVAGYTDSPLFKTGSPRSGKYCILGGTVYVNGSTTGIPVPAILSDIQAPFESYLDYDIAGNTASIKINNEDNPLRRRENHLYYYIGGVRLVSGSTETVIDPGTDFSLYEIIQEDCLSDIIVGGGTSTPCNPYEYEGPFKVVAGTTSGTVALDPFDDIGADPQLYTGFVVNGDLTIPAPIGSVEVGVYADVYAKIDLNTNNVSYEMEEPATDTQEQQEEQEDTPPDPNIIHVRLARISRGSIQYETVVLGGSTTGYNGNIKGNPVSIYSDFCAAPTPGLFPIELNKDVQFVTGGTVYEVIGGTLTGNYGVAPSGGTYAATVYATQEFDILQIQHGDIVLCGSTVTPEPPIVGSTYSGPFTVTVSDGTATIKCDDCPTYDDEDEITGFYSINGGGSTAMSVLEGVAADTGDYVYLQFSTGDPVLSTSESTSPGVYNVLLARVTGATSAAQLHYGNIYVDGRWS